MIPLGQRMLCHECVGGREQRFLRSIEKEQHVVVERRLIDQVTHHLQTHNLAKGTITGHT
jgi:hypothetical protein